MRNLKTLCELANSTDFIVMDTPLFIRVLEFAREDALKDELGDLQLHYLTEKALELLEGGKSSLGMDDYLDLIKATKRVG